MKQLKKSKLDKYFYIVNSDSSTHFHIKENGQVKNSNSLSKLESIACMFLIDACNYCVKFF